MDFGTGSGILAMFSVMAGANRVYAIEASDAVNYAKTLINFHGMDNKVFINVTRSLLLTTK
jgi:predicted RNA methylase